MTRLRLENQPIFWGTDGYLIEELRNVDMIFDSNGNQLTPTRGSIKIPANGVFFRNVQNAMTRLETINKVPITEIIQRNRQYREDKEINEREYQTSIHWEDHVIFDNNWSTMMAQSQIKPTFATVIIFFDSSKKVWTFVSQTIEYDSMQRKSFNLTPTKRIVSKYLNVGTSLRNSPRNNLRPVGQHRKREINYESLINRKVIAHENVDMIASNQNSILKNLTVAEIGDQLINSTNVNGNLMLLHHLLQMWNPQRNSSSYKNPAILQVLPMTRVEREVFASEIIEKFKDELFQTSVKCGIPKVIRQLISEMNFSDIHKAVSKKYDDGMFESIPQVMRQLIVERNKSKIIGRSSIKQYSKLHSMMKNCCITIERKITADQQYRLKRMLGDY